MRRNPAAATQVRAAAVPADLFPTDEEIIRRTYALMLRRAGDPGELFRRAEDAILSSAARVACRRHPKR